MKKHIILAITVLLLAACDSHVSTPAPEEKIIEKNTTIVSPPVKEEKKVENNTTIINPPAPPKTGEKKITTTTTDR